MKHILAFLSIAGLVATSQVAAQPEAPAENSAMAAQEAIVQADPEVRFTVLTSGLIRMEWDSTGKFTDDASFVFVNRRLPVPDFTVKKRGKTLTLSTEKLVLHYQLGSGRFTADNLQIVSADRKAPHAFAWKPGMQQTGNLKVTYRTLDRFNGDTDVDGNKMPIEEGLLATDGWTLIDDSGSFLFDDSPWPWVKTRRNPRAQDWYFMAYGHNYKGALKEFTQVAGRVPLPPRYAFGYWWSRYWAYSDKELRDLVGNFKTFSIPLDVLVIDMDWHRTDGVNDSRKDEFGQRPWWTGWTWNRDLFPSPEKFLAWTDNQQLKTTLNLHPASGIAPFEEQYGEFAEKMNFDTSTGRNIPHIGSDKKYMQTLFDVVLKPMERNGVDFWWLDWQQWPNDKEVEGLSNTWWLNYVFFTQMERERDTRPMLYHRWGGLGNHRYQIGFSGDAIISWESLAFQPYFTNCASNVLYGYWSHDIGGHTLRGQKRVLEPELYTRWMQYGTFSPIFRTHSTKDAVLNKEIWNFRGDYFKAQRDAIKLRYSLVPYIYTAARQCYDTGISLCRPMYYDYPEEAEAYEFRNQYQFGDALLVAPVVTPAVEGYSTVKVWLPAGNDWFEWQTGTLLKGGQVVERKFAIDEYPVYVKAGAIVPLYGEVDNLSQQPAQVRLAIFPGAEGTGILYEDNGNDKHYATQFATTQFATQRTGNTLTVTLSPRKGSYEGMPTGRQYALMLYGSAVPESIEMDGEALPYSYIGESLCLKIDLPETDCSKPQTVKIVYGDNLPEINDGLTGLFRKLTKATTELKYRHARVVVPAAMGSAEETSIQLEYFPERFNELIRKFRADYAKIPQEIQTLELSPEIQAWYLQAVGLN